METFPGQALRAAFVSCLNTNGIRVGMNAWRRKPRGAERATLRPIHINATDAVMLNDSPTLPPLGGVPPPIQTVDGLIKRENSHRWFCMTG